MFDFPVLDTKKQSQKIPQGPSLERKLSKIEIRFQIGPFAPPINGEVGPHLPKKEISS